MKRFWEALALCGLCLVLLCACGSTAEQGDEGQELEALTWQEQYDLGLRYLSEGSYEEAILAFTAAIEIDPKQPLAYIGRGDAYVEIATTLSIETQKDEITQHYKNAEIDFLAGIALNGTNIEAYFKLANVYVAIGDEESAIATLKQGYEKTGSNDFLSELEKLQSNQPDNVPAIVDVVGYIINNCDEYQSAWQSYIEIYQNESEGIFCSIDTYGVRFFDGVNVFIDGEEVFIDEARLNYDENLFDEQSELYNYETDKNGALINRTINMRGYFYRNDQNTDINGPQMNETDGHTYYNYRPNGDYVFHIIEHKN